MGKRAFDRKFGDALLRELSAGPAVYLFRDPAGSVLYAGKAKDIRRRLASYRNASRRKAHRKMRTLVREAGSLEIRPMESERAALLAENELIRTLRPRYNVDGAFSFLYPAFGLGARGHQTLLCLTTRRERYDALDLAWYGCFRSRLRAREAFAALAALLERVGHREPASRRRDLPRVRGSSLLAIRRGEPWRAPLARFLAGESAALLEALAVALLEKPDARADAVEVGDALRVLRDFYARDARPLRRVLRAAARAGAFVPQEERDSLFLAHRPPRAGEPRAQPG